MPQMGGRVCVCIALGICWGFLPNSVWFLRKKKRQSKHYLKIIVLAAVPGGGGGEMARGDGG